MKGFLLKIDKRDIKRSMSYVRKNQNQIRLSQSTCPLNGTFLNPAMQSMVFINTHKRCHYRFKVHD